MFVSMLPWHGFSPGHSFPMLTPGCGVGTWTDQGLYIYNSVNEAACWEEDSMAVWL